MAAVEPVNRFVFVEINSVYKLMTFLFRFFSAERSSPAPHLECLVGMDSADVSELYKVTGITASLLTTDH